jgi:hypothetical protein
MCKADADNCILALRNCIEEYERLEQTSKEQYQKNEFKTMRKSMEQTLKNLENEFGE